MWSGIPQLFLLPVMPLLMKRVDARLLVGLGLLLFAASCFINVDMSPDTAMDQLMLPQLMRAAGQPLATIPLTQLSVVGLTRRDTADSAGITSVMRNLGASIGIAMLSTVVQVREHVHLYGGHVGAMTSKKAAGALWPKLSRFWVIRRRTSSDIT